MAGNDNVLSGLRSSSKETARRVFRLLLAGATWQRPRATIARAGPTPSSSSASPGTSRRTALYTINGHTEIL
eukprot:6463133-Heterocapsa_arctica.AAC.1